MIAFGSPFKELLDAAFNFKNRANSMARDWIFLLCTETELPPPNEGVGPSEN